MADVLLKEFLTPRIALYQKIVSTLAGGGSGWSSRWAKVIVELHNLGHLMGGVIESIEAHCITPYQQATEAMSRITSRLITVRTFSIACSKAGMGAISNDIVEAGHITTTIQVTHGAQSPNIISAASVSLSFPPSETRKRLANPIDRLEDEAFLLAKVPFVDEQDPPTLKTVEFEVLGAFKGYARAKEEANTRLDEDIAALGGDETALKHIYTIWSMRGHAGGERRQVKDRTKESAAKK